MGMLLIAVAGPDRFFPLPSQGLPTSQTHLEDDRHPEHTIENQTCQN